MHSRIMIIGGLCCVQISLLQTARILVAVFDAIVAAINGDTSNSATGVT